MSGWADLVGQQLAAAVTARELQRASRGGRIRSPIEEPDLGLGLDPEVDERPRRALPSQEDRRALPPRGGRGATVEDFCAALAQRLNDVCRTDLTAREVQQAVTLIAREGWDIDVNRS